MNSIIRWMQHVAEQRKAEWRRSEVRATAGAENIQPGFSQIEFKQLWLLALFTGVTLLFLIYPEIDLWFSGLFFRVDQGFYWHDAWLVKLVYGLFRDLPYLWVPILIWLWIASWIWARHAEKYTRRLILFLFLALVIGPGLLVNGILKAESGRARPHLIEQFGGDKIFTPPLMLADQCESNCSFVSGHASMGFYFIALAWVLANRRWLYYGIGIGAIVGLGRIVQGGHFLSDVIFSYFAVYLATLLCARWILGRRYRQGTDSQ
jgi:lipid A 4'-phosphatase